MDTPETVEELDARVEKAYAAYVEAVGGTDEQHRPLAPYYELHTTHRTAWRQAVMAALTPVSEAERTRQRPQGAQAAGGAPAGLETAPAPTPPAPGSESRTGPGSESRTAPEPRPGPASRPGRATDPEDKEDTAEQGPATRRR